MTGQLSNSEQDEMGQVNLSPYALKSVDSDTNVVLDYAPSVVGRYRKKCHIVLNDYSISRIHCAIYWSEDRFCISDLGSQNGLYVNDKRIRFKKLSIGDRILIGRFLFLFIKLDIDPSEESKSGILETHNCSVNGVEFSLENEDSSSPVATVHFAKTDETNQPKLGNTTPHIPIVQDNPTEDDNISSLKPEGNDPLKISAPAVIGSPASSDPDATLDSRFELPDLTDMPDNESPLLNNETINNKPINDQTINDNEFDITIDEENLNDIQEKSNNTPENIIPPLPLEPITDPPSEIDGIRLSVLDSIGPNVINILEDEESSYSIQSTLKSEQQSENKNRKVYSVAAESREEEFQVKPRTILFSIDDFIKSPLVKYTFYLIVLLAIGWGLKMFWEAGPSDTEIYNTLQVKLQEIQEHRTNGARRSDWENLTKRSQAEMQPIIKYLEKNTTQEDLIKQELLRAARDCLPKMLTDSRKEVSRFETRYKEHLENVQNLQHNGHMIKAKNNSQIPSKPSGN